MHRTPVLVALGAAASAGHVLYPVGLWLATRGRPSPQPHQLVEWPAISVVIPAYREAGVIGAKVADVVANAYAGELEVLVVVDGDEDTAEAARAAGARVSAQAEREGKSQALNRGVALAAHDLVVFSDANNRLEPGALAALVRWFGDERVGAVAGEKIEEDAGGEQLFWRFESWLKRREAVLGTTIGLVGELGAVRRQAWRPIPPDIAIDDLWTALDMAERGYAVAYEPEARAYDPPVGTAADQWERRVRNVAGAIHVFSRRRHQLGPAGGLMGVQAWGHRLWRYTLGPFAHVLLLGLCVRWAGTSRLARLGLAGHAVAGVGAARQATGRDNPRWLGPVAQVLFLQGVALAGVWRYLRGGREVLWRKPDR